MSSFRLGTKLDTPGWNGQNGPAAARPTVGLNRKNPPKMRLKNSWNWLVLKCVTLKKICTNCYSTTVGIFLSVTHFTYTCNSFTNIEYQVHAMTGNGNQVNLLKLVWKNSWNLIKFSYFWRVLTIWNHCAHYSTEQLLLQHCQQPTNSHQIMSQTLHSTTTIWSVLVKKREKEKKAEKFFEENIVQTQRKQKPKNPTALLSMHLE